MSLNNRVGVIADLLGRWRFERVIEGEGSHMTGEASVAADDAGARYLEEGTLVLCDGRTIAAHRRYRFGGVGDLLLIDFADGPDVGRRFVDLRFAGSTAKAVHLCGPDRYDVTWRLDLPDAFATDIAVAGPRKNYRAVTRYDRIAHA